MTIVEHTGLEIWLVLLAVGWGCGACLYLWVGYGVLRQRLLSEPSFRLMSRNRQRLVEGRHGVGSDQLKKFSRIVGRDGRILKPIGDTSCVTE